MQLSTFCNVLLQLFDSLKVIGMIFLGTFKVKETSFLFLCVMIFQSGYLCFTPNKSQLLRINPTLYNIKKTGMIWSYHSRLLCYLLLILDRLVAVRTVMCKQVFQI